MATILVVEDNPVNMQLAHAVLASAGHQVVEAADGDLGLQRARELMPDLILMDVQLPGVDGLEATRRLRNDPATRHLKIVALTALAMKGDRERILAAGCDDYVAKPYRYRELLECVDRVLG